ncbi:MAG: FAD-dependent oxidoreductase [Anaerolineales bacterium]|nr:MAG: FAD-dependent oxidoreductase [Anaerolineales bacterium]
MVSEDTEKIGAALVVGGGIAGVQAALDLAESGIKVYLVEKSPAIGGKMAQLDKTFPTNDCAMCILSPKLVEAGRHRNIEIITNAELTRLEGQASDFTATVLRKARYVDINECTSCNECTAVCPVEVPDEFNEGLQTRKAIYRPYAQAVPNAFIVERKGRAPCTNACPAGVSAQGYIALIQQRRYADALRLIRERIPFATVCGRTCHHPCEGRCNRRYIDEPVAIQALKRFVTDRVYLGYLPPPEKLPRTRDEWVAIVGAGPAGLTAAQDLVKMGYGVTVFEALPEPGGMMRVGIPEYRLSKDVLRRDIADILALGVELKLNSPIRDPMELFDMGYQAVYLAVGTYGEPRLNIEGEDLKGVVSAIALLRDVSLGKMEGVGERVAVVGGGITAVDAATTALRLGAKEVSLIYRRGRGEIPAYGWELAEAENEGVRLIQWAMPLCILGDNGRVASLECAETKTRGREEPKPVPGTEFILEVDTVIRALGQSSDRWYMDCTPDTYLGDAETLATHVPGIFAGPGRVPGAGLIINAIAMGHQAATSIDRYLRGEPLKQPPKPKPPVVEWTREEAQEKVQRGEVVPTPRVPRPLLPLEERVERFLEVDMGYTERMALAEAARCLNCGVCSECGECVIACQRGAINYDDVDRLEELKVGAVILAPGYKPYDARLAEEYGFERYPNVVTSLQLERLACASGPTDGHVLRPSDQKEPKRIAFLQCVGSRDQEHDYCSSVCCMYATKEAMLALEHMPGVQCHIFQMDMRAFSKGFDAYFERGKELGIQYIRCRISSLKEDPKTRDIIVRYQPEEYQQGSTLREEKFDLMVLSVGLEPPPDARKLAQTVGIERDERGFCRRNPFHPVETTRPGVYVCGTFAEPKDIPESVIEASGAAAAALTTIGHARGTLVTEKVYPPEVAWLEDEEPRIGVFVCSCGSNIAGVVDVNQVVEYARTLPDVVHAENTIYTCSADSLKLIQERIAEHKLNRVIVSSCTPRTHEPLFRDTIREAGLNPYLFEMANIRDQCSWVHSGEPEAATVKSKDLTRMAVGRSRLLMPLYTEPQSLSHEALVIGGGVAGMAAALNLAEQGFGVYLVERKRELGGRLRHIYYTANGGDPQAYLRELIGKVQANLRIEVLTGYEVAKSGGFVGNFKTTVASVDDPTRRLIEHGVTIVATGGREYRGSAYLLGQDKVVTQDDLEQLLAKADQSEGAEGERAAMTLDACRSVVMIQCVGPWDDGGDDAPDFYCSRVCCTVAIKNAMAIKKRNPGTSVYILYKDMRTYGFKEALYTQARDEGVIFLRYDDENKPKVQRNNGQLQVTVNDPVLQAFIALKPDLLVLSEAMVPSEGSQELAELLKFSCTLEGFFLEAHVKLRPVDFPAEGIFLCGAAHYPKFIDETIAQANAAAARATTILSKDVLQVGGVVAVVDEEKCTGCLTCVRICSYDVPQMNPSKVGAGGILGAAEIAAAACQGCGSCAAECPAKAIQLQHYRDEQMIAKEEALFAEGVMA